jgi:sialic acid synthase SpsE
MKLLTLFGGGKMKEIVIGSRKISKNKFEKPYIIAEIGVNHEGSIDKAKFMIEEAKKAGADAVKFQSYKAEKLASKNSPAYWDLNKESTNSQYELFKKHDKFGEKEFIELAHYSERVKIDFLSTPFDEEAVDFLEPLVPAYKIASADITNVPFLRYVASKKKPIILSTGASKVSEIWNAIEILEKAGNNQIALLHCVLNYPTEYNNANLGMIKDMKEKFNDYIIGYSDHTLPNKIEDVIITSWILGAQIIEKHFTFDKSLPGNDHYHSMDSVDLKKVTQKINDILEIYGKDKKSYIESENIARKNARRSIVAKKDIKEGELFNNENLTTKRPALGIPALYYDELIGRKARRFIEEDEIINYGDFE